MVPLPPYVAQVTVDPPQSTTVTLGGTATFTCTASNVAAITFVVAGVDTSMWASRGISQPAPAYSGSYTTANLSVFGYLNNSGLEIFGRVFLTAAAYVDVPPPAVLTIQGLLMRMVSYVNLLVLFLIIKYIHAPACMYSVL